MIGVIIKGKSFKGCISYVLKDKHAKILDSEGVLTADNKTIVNSFYMQSLLNPKLAKSVGHIPISYAKEDEPRLTDNFMVKLAREYMKEMGIENTQFIIVRHRNTNNPHCHIVFNRVNNEGKTISDKNDQYLNEKVCKLLKDKYRLTYGKGKDNTNIQKLKGAEKTKYEIYHAIKESLPKSAKWNQFEQLLRLQSIEIAYKYKGKSDQIQGISFKKGEYSFKGSAIDRKFSYLKLNTLIETYKKYNQYREKQRLSQPELNMPDNSSKSVLDSVLDIIQPHAVNPEDEAVRKQLEFEARKRKKKRRGLKM